MVKTMVKAIDDTARIKRLTEFATDAAHLPDQRSTSISADSSATCTETSTT